MTLRLYICVRINGDGVDVVKGLCESVKGQSAGDIDLNDGKLQLQLQWVDWSVAAKRSIMDDLGMTMNVITAHLEFIHSFQHHNCHMQLSLIIMCRAAEGQYTEYEEKPDTWNVTDTTLALSWEIGARKSSIVKDVAYVLTEVLAAIDVCSLDAIKQCSLSR